MFNWTFINTSKILRWRYLNVQYAFKATSGMKFLTMTVRQSIFKTTIQSPKRKGLLKLHQCYWMPTYIYLCLIPIVQLLLLNTCILQFSEKELCVISKNWYRLTLLKTSITFFEGAFTYSYLESLLAKNVKKQHTR